MNKNQTKRYVVERARDFGLSGMCIETKYTSGICNCLSRGLGYQYLLIETEKLVQEKWDLWVVLFFFFHSLSLS